VKQVSKLLAGNARMNGGVVNDIKLRYVKVKKMK